jgi:hypothetical protein
MDHMFRLDFSRGTVDRIDPNVPPRGWQPSPFGAEREMPRLRRGKHDDESEGAARDEPEEG